jgi:hypothetical protein
MMRVSTHHHGETFPGPGCVGVFGRRTRGASGVERQPTGRIVCALSGETLEKGNGDLLHKALDPFVAVA